MKNSQKKYISLILTAALLLSTLFCVVSCADRTDTADTTSGDDTTTSTPETTVPVDENGYLLDSLPDNLAFNEKIKLFTWTDYGMEEFKIDAIDSVNMVNSAIYERNLAVEERLGVTLEFYGVAGNASNTDGFLKAVRADIESQLSEYDIIAAYSLTQAMVAYNGLCRNLLDYDNFLDFSKPWWPDNLMSEATIRNSLLFASGDISANMLYSMYVNYYNTALISEYSLEDPQDLVASNQWTIEKFMGMAKSISGDLDGSGAESEGDKFGFLTTDINMDPWFYAMGLRTVDKSNEDSLSVSSLYFSEKTISVIEDFNNLIWNTDNAMLVSASAKGRNSFTAGNTLFLVDAASAAITDFSKSTIDYRIVPLPKYDTNQENYVTTIGNGFTMYSISVGSQRADTASAVLECLASESYRKVTPALFEVSLKIRYSPDDINSQMYDISRSTVSFDIGRLFHKAMNYKPQKLFREAISGNSNSWANVGAANTATLNGYLEKITQVVSDNAG